MYTYELVEFRVRRTVDGCVADCRYCEWHSATTVDVHAACEAATAHLVDAH